jgi:DNA polymerase-3 subunit epsilon
MDGLQLRLDGADRLVALLEETQEPASIAAAASLLLRTSRVPVALARRVVEELVTGDARLAWRSADDVALAAWRKGSCDLGDARFCVVDLETTGLRASADRIVEVGAVLVEAFEQVATFERLIDPGVPIPAAISRITGITDRDIRGRGRIGPALDAFRAFAGNAVLVAHNARFDVGFLDAELRRTRGQRLACPVLDTVLLARRLLPGRSRYSLGALAERFATEVAPCHRALPDAQATAELLLGLIGKAQERGATTLDDLLALARPAARSAPAKRHLAEAAPRRPGTYVMRDRDDRALYVGTAANLRTRTLSYFRDRPAPRAVERALGAVERLEFREASSAFEARLDEIRAINELRPAANRRGARPDRLVSLSLELDGVARLSIVPHAALDAAITAGPVGARRESEVVVEGLRRAYGLRSCRSARPTEPGCLEGRLGRCLAPCRGGSAAEAHAASAASLAEALAHGGGVPIDRLRARRARLVLDQRFEEAAALRDAEAALRVAGGRLRAIREARATHGVVLAPHRSDGLVAAFAIAFGLEVERRVIPRSGEARLETASLAASVEHAWRAGAGVDGPSAVHPERRDEALLLAEAFAGRIVEVQSVRFDGDARSFGDAVRDARARVPAA